MKVALFVTPLDIPGGGARQALRLAIELNAMGHETRLYTPSMDRAKCYPELIDKLEVEVWGPSAPERVLSSVGNRANLDGLRRATILGLRRADLRGAQVINCHDATSNWAAAKASRRAGVPAVWMCNEPPFWLHQPLQRRVWQRRLAGARLGGLDPEGVFLRIVDAPSARAMRGIVVLDRKNEERVRKLYGMPSAVVHSGVDAPPPGAADAGRARAAHALDSGFTILHVGYAAPWKGQADAIEALRRLLPHAPDAQLVLVGQAVKATYGPAVQTAQLAGHVRLLEGLSDPQLADLYAACDTLVFPADQTWGLNVTEAMVAGKPVVVSRAAGVSEVIEPGKTGLLFDHGDVAALTEHLRALHASPELCTRLGQAGAAFGRTHLSWRSYAEGMLAQFQAAAPG